MNNNLLAKYLLPLMGIIGLCLGQQCQYAYMDNTGMLVSIKTDTLMDGLKPLFWTYVMKAMNGQKLTNIEHTHGSLDNITFFVTDDTVDVSISQSLDDPMKFHLRANKIGLGFTADQFSYQEQFVQAHGNVAAQFHDASLIVDVKLYRQFG